RAALDKALAHQAELRTKSSAVDAAQKAAEAVRGAAVIVAPAAGRVAELFAAKGKLLDKDAPLVRFEPAGMYFETFVDTLKLGGAAVDSVVTVSIGSDCSGDAKILEIADATAAG